MCTFIDKPWLVQAGTRIDWVPGVKQKLLSRRVPQVDSWLQLCVHPERSQKPTLVVAARQFVLGVLRHAAPPVYTVHGPPQTSSTRLLQYVTVVSSADRGASGFIAFPMKVSSASVVDIQCIICS